MIEHDCPPGLGKQETGWSHELAGFVSPSDRELLAQCETLSQK